MEFIECMMIAIFLRSQESAGTGNGKQLFTTGRYGRILIGVRVKLFLIGRGIVKILLKR